MRSRFVQLHRAWRDVRAVAGLLGPVDLARLREGRAPLAGPVHGPAPLQEPTPDGPKGRHPGAEGPPGYPDPWNPKYSTGSTEFLSAEGPAGIEHLEGPAGRRFLKDLCRPAVVPRVGRPFEDPRGYCTRRKVEARLGCAACGEDHRKAMPCRMLDCATDRKLVRQRRGLAKYRQIGGVPTGHWVFTFPGSWRSRLGTSQLVAIRRQLVRVLDDWHDGSIDVGRRGWIVAFHPTGDPTREAKARARAEGREVDDPSRWVPHFHVASPCAQLVDGQVDLMKPHLPLDALMDLRTAWQGLLDVVAGYLGLQQQPANVHYRYATDVHKRLHHLTYDCRPFTRWYAQKGNEPHERLPATLKSPQAYGLCASHADAEGLDAWREAVAGDVAELGDGSPPTDQDVREGRACPCCRGPLEMVRDADGRPVTAMYGSDKWRQWCADGLKLLDEYQAPPTGPPARAAPADDLPY